MNNKIQLNLIEIFSFTIFMSNGAGQKQQQLMISKLWVWNVLKNSTFLNILSVGFFVFLSYVVQFDKLNFERDLHFKKYLEVFHTTLTSI